MEMKEGGNEVSDKIKKIIFEILGLSDYSVLSDDSVELAKLGIHSVNFIKIVVFIEKEFNITFDDEALDEGKTLTLLDLVSYVNLKLSEAK